MRIRPLVGHRQFKQLRVVHSAVLQAGESARRTAGRAAEESGRSVGPPPPRHRHHPERVARRRERTPLWVAVEVANRVDGEGYSTQPRVPMRLPPCWGEIAALVVGYRVDAPTATGPPPGESVWKSRTVLSEPCTPQPYAGRYATSHSRLQPPFAENCWAGLWTLGERSPMVHVQRCALPRPICRDQS